MADLEVLAIGFGVLPIAALMIYSFRTWILAHREATWGGLIGVLAFLGLSHAMAHVLESKSFLFGGASAIGTILFLVAGLGLGTVLGWVLFEGPWIPTEPSKIAWAAAAFLALHSFGDGLVLGSDFLEGLSPVVRLDSVTISASVVHRFIEGAILVVPAIAAAWKPSASLLALLVSIASIPAAVLPRGLASVLGLVEASTTTIALGTFLAAVEATLVLLILVRGFIPIASANRGMGWIAWCAIGFIAISFVHFLVE